MGGSISYDKGTCKVLLKQASTRLKILANKTSNLSKGARREVASMLEKKQVEAACLKVEHIIRDDFTVEVYDILQLYLDMVLARIPLLDPEKDRDAPKRSKDMPPPPPPQEIRQAIATLIYSSQHIEVEELRLLTEQFGARFGREFAELCADNRHEAVAFKVVSKLSYQTPESRVVFGYLEAIALQYKVDYKAPEIKAGAIRTTFEGPDVDIASGNKIQPAPPPGDFPGFPSVATQPPISPPTGAAPEMHQFNPPPPPVHDPPPMSMPQVLSLIHI
eukprot:TRINITY_DN14918_c0_g1_i1.p1 TRINITY_DN14918_c0_g1~~TRINITY_DN14918_c0_g1_i1.p1  ORF type:complete len:276 (-),score=73.99 TRINITY_DN14918_c0_g1_i1:181-1008(-)